MTEAHQPFPHFRRQWLELQQLIIDKATKDVIVSPPVFIRRSGRNHDGPSHVYTMNVKDKQTGLSVKIQFMATPDGVRSTVYNVSKAEDALYRLDREIFRVSCIVGC